MRQKSLLAALSAALCLLVLPAPAGARTLLRLQADHIAFYYDRYLVEADGDVRVETSDGMTVRGDAFSMDLKLNRFLIASHVHLTSPGGSLNGAAISDFLDFHRIYFIPVMAAPDRWTYLNGDFTHPEKGREMPGDVFDFPQLASDKPNLTARSAVIGVRSFARFQRVTSYLFGAPVPLPSFYINFSTNQDLAQNSLSGASFDATWNAAGNDNAITALHVRHDPTNGGYLSFEQHFAGQHEYAVFSVNPATRPLKFWNLFTGDRIGNHFQVTTFSQLVTTQSWLREPTASTIVNYLTLTQAFHQSYIQALGTFTNYNLVRPLAGLPNHPSAVQLSSSTFTHRIAHTPLYEQIRYGLGFNHDAYGLQTFGSTEYTTIWNHLVGFSLYTPSMKFGNHYNPYKTFYFNATFDKQRQWFSVPHHIDSTTTVASVSRQISRAFSAYTSYTVQNTGDRYNDGSQYCQLPSPPPGTPATPPPPHDFCSATGFRGIATLRTVGLQMTYSSNPNFLVSVLARRHTDFPRPRPDLYGPPQYNVLGQYTQGTFIGQPPFDVTGDVRARIAPHISIDVQRTYFFNYAPNIQWSPQFVVTVSQ